MWIPWKHGVTALEAWSQLAAFIVGTVAALKRARAAPRLCHA
jgi:hypothetical protein